MTPEQLAQLQQQLSALREQQDQALRHKAAEDERRRRAQLYGTLGAIGGAALGIGLLKLLNSDRGRAKAEQLMEDVGDQCTDAVKQKLAGFLGGELPGDAPSFNPDTEIKDADYEIMD